MRSRTLHSWSSLGRRRAASWKTTAGPLESVADDGEEQLPLRPEELEQVRLGDADGAGDRLGRCAGVAAVGEFVERGGDDSSRRSSAVWRVVVAAAFMRVT